MPNDPLTLATLLRLANTFPRKGNKLVVRSIKPTPPLGDPRGLEIRGGMFLQPQEEISQLKTHGMARQRARSVCLLWPWTVSGLFCLVYFLSALQAVGYRKGRSRHLLFVFSFLFANKVFLFYMFICVFIYLLHASDQPAYPEDPVMIARADAVEEQLQRRTLP